jgi:glycosyltransferase involved in cell wall biosynthesis
MAPKVSICIPTYNRKDYLRETIESVFAQTYKDYEVVIVDDGSTDGTAEMLKNIGLPIRYYWQKNSGDAAARNKIIKLAQGEFITFIDSDDLLMHDAVDRMMKVMEAEGGEIIVYGPYLRIDQNGHVYGRFKRRLYSVYVTKYLFQNIFVYSCGSMFPKKVLEMANGFDTSLPVCSDYDLWLRLSLKYRFIALAESTFKRRRHTGNLSALSTENHIIELKVLERFYYERGGDSVVPKRIAMHRLSKEEYRVAVAALRENKLQVAREYLSKSFRRRPNPKSLIMMLPAILKRCSDS